MDQSGVWQFAPGETRRVAPDNHRPTGAGGRVPILPRSNERTAPHRPWANAALLLVSIVVSLGLIEGGYRYAVHVPMFELVDWRATKVVRSEYQAIADSVLGWTVQPWIDTDDFSTIDYGIRANFNEKTIRTGGILAVGDSFTQGWEVDDDETWPSYLEKLSGVPVVNAGVGGYGTDQIILRAEAMLPIVRPNILIIGFLEADMFRTGHSVFGAPKPYFTLERGELRYHPPDLTEHDAQHAGPLASLALGARQALGYSATADYLLARLAPNYWYSSDHRLSYQR